MALLPTNPRDRNLVLVTLFFVGGAIAYQQMVWSPKSVELQHVSGKLDTLEMQNKDAKVQVAKGTASKMKIEAAAYSRELEVLRGLVPTQNEVPALLDAVSNAARRAGLELSDVAPDGVVQGDQFDTYKYKLTVTGPYHRIGEFLANVGSLPRIVSPINVTLGTSGRASEVKARSGEVLLDAKFGIQTYVAHASIKATTSKAGAP
jgi:type IV pilus assembly protein PilO